MINNRSDCTFMNRDGPMCSYRFLSERKRVYYAVYICWSSQSSAAKTRSLLDIHHTLLVSKARRRILAPASSSTLRTDRSTTSPRRSGEHERVGGGGCVLSNRHTRYRPDIARVGELRSLLSREFDY